MRLKELIKLLQEFEEQHGDLKIKLMWDNGENYLFHFLDATCQLSYNGKNAVLILNDLHSGLEE